MDQIAGSLTQGWFFFVPAPSKPPEVVSAESNEPTSITVDWTHIPEQHWGGQLKGYIVKYKKFLETNFTVKKIHPGYQTTTLRGLKPYSLYWVEVVGYNSAGEGPPEFAVLETQQGGKNKKSLLFEKRKI